MIVLILAVLVAYHLGQNEEENAIALNSPGARAARAAGATLSPTDAKLPPPSTDVNALPTGDVKPSSTTP